MPETYTYPSGFALKYVYNSRGFMSQVRRLDNDNLLWEATQQNERGQWTVFSSPDHQTIKSYDDYGFPTRSRVYTSWGKQMVQDFHYEFNSVTGNLSWRSDSLSRQTEHFSYDTDLHNRLTGWEMNGNTIGSLHYKPNGNIAQKSDVSTSANSYTYDDPNGKPDNVTGIVAPTPDFEAASGNQNITYTLFNKVKSIENSNDGWQASLDITYGPNNQRKYSRLTIEPGGLKVPILTDTYYLDSYEETKEVMLPESKIHYLHSPAGLFGILVERNNEYQLYYVQTDYLGSITGITDAQGNLVESLSNDPWGRRRKATDWTDYNISSTLFDRGFTGHEHLPQFGLINMNGRVYDPFLARFLSPDPFVQAPTYTQNFNRYSYAFNNPLKYTDPDGEWVHLAFGAMIGGYINLVANAKKVQKPWQAFAYFGVGALAGGLSAGIGAGVGAALAGNAAAGGGFAAGFLGTATISSTGFVAGAISGAAAGFTNGLVSGTGNQLIQGKKFGDAFVKGGLDQAWRQGLGGAAIGGIAGGIHAKNNNRNFWTGDSYTYELPAPELYASTNNSITADQSDFTVQNRSGETIYYKPESTDPLRGIKGDGAYPIKDGRGIKHAIDGVTAPGKHAQVFKIIDPFNSSSIIVSHSSVSINRAYFIGELNLNKLGGGGWLSVPPDKGWFEIFKRSGYVF